MSKKLIRFDWAMKKLLRNKANFDILEGLLSELLLFDVTIQEILEGESNKQTEYDKYNRVDILVKTQADELVLVEIQNDSETDYFQRMLYGVSRLATDYIKEGEVYGKIKKIYSINIVYFGLGQGKDYVYEYQGNFVGLHEKDILQPTAFQKKTFQVEKIADIFPKYYLLKINNFDKVAENTLDEWIYFLKTSEVKDNFRAKGLDKAKEKLLYENLSDEDKKIYIRSQENKRIERSVIETAEMEAAFVGKIQGIQEGKIQGIQEGKIQGIQEGKMEIAKNAIRKNIDDELIAALTELTLAEIKQLRAWLTNEK
jgi:predicted transposase/invertase (TIGR01784 family)